MVDGFSTLAMLLLGNIDKAEHLLGSTFMDQGTWPQADMRPEKKKGKS